MLRSLVHAHLLAALAVAWAASAALGQGGGNFLNRPMAQWTAELHDSQPRVRRSAAFALGKIGSQQAVPDLVAALRDSDPSVRAAGAFALGEIGAPPGVGPAPAALGALLQSLPDPDARVRRSAAYALGRYGEHANAAGPALREALKDREPMVRQNAAWALGQLGPDARKAALDGLVGLLDQDQDALVRRDAALALGKVGREGRSALPVLLDHFHRDPDPAVRKTALDALVGVVSAEDTRALKDLVPSLKDKDPDVVRSAAFAVANIGGAEAGEALPVLCKALDDPDAQTRRLAAAALANIGPYAEKAVPPLTVALGDPDPEVRRSAALALGTMGPRARSALPALIKALGSSENEDVRKYAAEALSNIDPNDPDAVAALLRVLDEKGNYRVRHRVVWALERLKDFEQPGVVEGLAKTLFEAGPDARLLRYEAAKTLALKLGPRVPDKTLDVLLEALRDNNVKIYQGTGAKVSSSGTEAKTGEAQVKETGFGDWRRIVAIAFARVGERAKRPEILEGLKKLSEDSFDEATRKTAKDALRLLEKEK